MQTTDKQTKPKIAKLKSKYTNYWAMHRGDPPTEDVRTF